MVRVVNVSNADSAKAPILVNEFLSFYLAKKNVQVMEFFWDSNRIGVNFLIYRVFIMRPGQEWKSTRVCRMWIITTIAWFVLHKYLVIIWIHARHSVFLKFFLLSPVYLVVGHPDQCLIEDIIQEVQYICHLECCNGYLDLGVTSNPPIRLF